jgi:DNA-binding NtrC family response regulator
MKRVLLLDDDIDLCEVMVEMTLELGATACMAVSSLAELKKITKIRHRFDLIFIDMNLGFGEPSGIEVYDWLREIGYNGQVAFFSGHDRTHPMIQMALEYPNVSLLEKPPSSSELEAILR